MVVSMVVLPIFIGNSITTLVNTKFFFRERMRNELTLKEHLILKGKVTPENINSIQNVKMITTNNESSIQRVKLVCKHNKRKESIITDYEPTGRLNINYAILYIHCNKYP